MQRQGGYKKYSQVAVEAALVRVKFGELSARRAAQLYLIPKGTILDKVIKRQSLINKTVLEVCVIYLLIFKVFFLKQ